MKRQAFTISFLFFLCFNLLYGQDTITTYFNRNWKKCDKDFANFYRKAYPDSLGMWIVKDYHMNGQLQMFGKYSDKRLKKQQGTAIFYYYNGNVAQIGQYLDNKMIGYWKEYSTYGQISAEGKKTNDKNDSIWTYYDLDGRLFGTKNYIKGKADGVSTWYYESGRVCEVMTYKNDKTVSKVNYDENGNIIKVVEKDCNVEFIGGNQSMVLFLEKNLKYPKELELKGKEGIVMFHFIVRKDGTIDHVEFQKSDEPLFNQEAIRVFSLIKKMKPAREHGRLGDGGCTLPIRFKLW